MAGVRIRELVKPIKRKQRLSKMLVERGIVINGKRYTTLVNEGTTAIDLIKKIASENNGYVVTRYYPEFNSEEIIAIKIGRNIVVKSNETFVNVNCYPPKRANLSELREKSNHNKGGIHLNCGKNGVVMSFEEGKPIYLNAEEWKISGEMPDIHIVLSNSTFDPQTIEELGSRYNKKYELIVAHSEMRLGKMNSRETYVFNMDTGSIWKTENRIVGFIYENQQVIIATKKPILLEEEFVVPQIKIIEYNQEDLIVEITGEGPQDNKSMNKIEEIEEFPIETVNIFEQKTIKETINVKGVDPVEKIVVTNLPPMGVQKIKSNKTRRNRTQKKEVQRTANTEKEKPQENTKNISKIRVITTKNNNKNRKITTTRKRQKVKKSGKLEKIKVKHKEEILNKISTYLNKIKLLKQKIFRLKKKLISLKNKVIEKIKSKVKTLLKTLKTIAKKIKLKIKKAINLKNKSIQKIRRILSKIKKLVALLLFKLKALKRKS